MKTRLHLYIEYEGTRYHGWQRQGGTGETIQQKLEEAIFGLTGRQVVLCASGRTDAGVHARGQIVQFDLDEIALGGIWDPQRFMRGLNHYLQGEMMAVWKVQQSHLHVRFDAIFREYEYLLITRPSPLMQNRALFVPRRLDLDRMRQGCRMLEGYHNFEAFRARSCQAKSPWRTLEYATIMEAGILVSIRFGAISFLHHQVRMMVGTLLALGWGREIDIQNLFDHPEQGRRGGPTVPPHGLYLDRITLGTA